MRESENEEGKIIFLEKQIDCRNMSATEKKLCQEQVWGFANILNISEPSEMHFWLLQVTFFQEPLTYGSDFV